MMNIVLDIVIDLLTLETLTWGGGSLFLALNFCRLTDWQKLWYNCSLFVNTFFDVN